MSGGTIHTHFDNSKCNLLFCELDGEFSFPSCIAICSAEPRKFSNMSICFHCPSFTASLQKVWVVFKIYSFNLRFIMENRQGVL